MKRNLAEAGQWIWHHPVQATFLSFQHVFDLFTIATLWPADSFILQKLEEVSQWFFWVLILFPAYFYLAKNFRSLIKLDKEFLGEILLILPLLSLMMTVFCTVGEIRYRIPFDGFLMILAARYWMGKEKLKPGILGE